MRRQHPPDQFFIGAVAIQRGGVEQRHAQLQRLQQYRLALLGRWRHAICMAEVHATEADGGDFNTTYLTLQHIHVHLVPTTGVIQS